MSLTHLLSDQRPSSIQQQRERRRRKRRRREGARGTHSLHLEPERERREEMKRPEWG